MEKTCIPLEDFKAVLGIDDDVYADWYDENNEYAVSEGFLLCGLKKWGLNRAGLQRKDFGLGWQMRNEQITNNR
jgi:hypothetical protein